MNSGIIVVGALVERQGEDGIPRVFLARRALHAGHGGLWELPGGKVEPGEEPAAALSRELREELGVETTILGSPMRYEASIENSAFVFLVFPLDFLDNPTILTAHDTWSYVAGSELGDYALAPLDGPVLADWVKRNIGIQG